jgi:hypothetical protein
VRFFLTGKKDNNSHSTDSSLNIHRRAAKNDSSPYSVSDEKATTAQKKNKFFRLFQQQQDNCDSI